MFERISYEKLNARQQENYNFQKIAGHLADYGFNCLRLSDDWNGADFIACHVNGEDFLKVQTKGRLSLDKKYVGKNIFIAFLDKKECFVYPHDELLRTCQTLGTLTEDTRNWSEHGTRSWSTPPAWAIEWLEQYRISP